MDINQLLMQMREIRGQVQTSAIGPETIGNAIGSVNNSSATGQADRTGFADMLKSAVNSVSETQQKSSELQRAFEMGDPQVDITQVMIQMQKASVSFEAMTQVRNRLVTAYQDIMNMPI
jgi:flagellar hook-basal body complex protein FliE